MQNPLTIEEVKTLASGRNMKVMRIGGFEEGELEELKSKEHSQAKEDLLCMIDQRNCDIATVWMRGYGIYGCWFDNEYAYLNVGTSCD